VIVAITFRKGYHPKCRHSLVSLRSVLQKR